MTALDDNRIIAITHRCVACEAVLQDRHRILSAYLQQDIISFERQVELGIVGSNARNYWVHVDCTNPTLEGFKLTPDIHHCIKCSNGLKQRDIVSPVFQVTDPEAINPNDPEDKGVALNERVYFIHVNCTSPSLTDRSELVV